jgi:hypothetical protein
VSTVEILAVTPLAADDPRVELHLDSPAAASSAPGYSFILDGWAVPRDSALAWVDLHVEADDAGDGGFLARLPARERPDIAARNPENPHAVRCGFRGGVNALRLGEHFEIVVEAALEGEARIPVASISGRRSPLEVAPEPAVAPVMLMSEGRSGSTWVAHMLGRHPEVVAYQPFRFEPRFATYWAHVLLGLSDPVSVSQTLQPEFRGWRWWTGETRTAPPVDLAADPAAERFLTKESVEALAAFCRGQVERFYAHVAAEAGKPPARYFVERALGGSWYTAPLIRELFPGAREIYLVRDFRDVVCSMLAYNEKTGRELFGRGLVASDEEFVRETVGFVVGRLLSNWRRRKESAFLLRYEDLMLDPHATLAPLLDHLGIESGAETVKDMVASARATRAERQQEHMTSSDETASIGRWQTELDPALGAVATETFSEALREFGYRL